MKLFLIILLLIPLAHSQSNELCDENGNPIIKIASLVGIPNCLNPDTTRDAKKLNKQEGLCGECKSNFQRNADLTISSIDPKSKKELFIKIALDGYKKVLTDNLVEAIKLRALQPTGSNFSKSINACKLKSMNELTKGCSQETRKIIQDTGIIGNINRDLSNELASFITDDPNFNPGNTLLKREQRACFISEKDLLLISSRAAEEALTPQMLDKLASLDPDDYLSTNHLFLEDDIMENYEGDLSQLSQSLRSHPLLANYMDDPAKFIEFVKSIPTPRNTENLRAKIYNAESGNNFDNDLAESCKSSFEVINKNLCSSDFNSGKFNLDAFSNYRQIKGTELPSFDSPLADKEVILNANAEVLKYCDINPDENKIKLSGIQNSLTSGMMSVYQDLSFVEFNEVKHKTEIGNLNRKVCQMANRPCTQDTFECKVLQKYNDLKNSGSLESKLARSSNLDVNSVLRSMIGDTSNLEPKTKEILIANGIIPRDDGTMVAQPDIPERTTEYFANNNTQNNQPARTTAQIAQTKSNTNQATRQPFTADESYSNSQANTVSPNQESFADFSDILNDSSEELQSIQDEIRRRLSGLPESRKSDPEQTREIVRESFRRRGRQLSPQQMNAISDRIMNSQRTPASSQFASSSTDDSNSASVSDAETEMERFRNGQRDAALMGMAGAQQVAARNGDRAPASVEAEKELTTIALNLPQDPQVKLSEVFVNKLNMNDSETQLLKVLMRNKNNFLLQINSLNFKIQFNDQNSFNLLLENGNREEAERIRPQLEMFLRRLRS